MEVPSNPRIPDAILEVFDRVSCDYPDELLSALLPVDKTLEPGKNSITYVVDAEMQEVREFVNAFKSMLVGTGVDQRLKARVEIVVYCHIMEADLLFVILWNLLRILKQESCIWTFSRVTKRGETHVCEYPREKISEIARLSDEMELTVGEVLEDLWHGDLRNAFSHSQYFLASNYFVPTSRLSPVSRKADRTPHPVKSYSYEEIHDLCKSAENLLTAFIDAYRRHIEPFKDGNPHRIQAGSVRWGEHGMWIWA